MLEHDFISSAFNTVGVAVAVEQFLLAPLRCSFQDVKCQRRRLFVDRMLSNGSVNDDSSIATGNSYQILDSRDKKNSL